MATFYQPSVAGNTLGINRSGSNYAAKVSRRGAAGIPNVDYSANPGYGQDIPYDQTVEKTRQTATDALTRLAAGDPNAPANYGAYNPNAVGNAYARNGTINGWTDLITPNNAQVTGPLITQLNTREVADALANGSIPVMGTDGKPIIASSTPAAAPAAKEQGGLLGLLQSLFGQTPLAKLGGAVMGPEGLLSGMVKERPANMVMGEDVATPREIARSGPTMTGGQKRLAANREKTYSQRQSQLKSSGSISTRNGSAKPGDVRRSTATGKLMTLQKDGRWS